MKLLVTGGLGFIGSNFILKMLDDNSDMEILNIDAELDGANRKNLNDLENSKSRILCTLFRQPLKNRKILAGIFSQNGDILELFESN